MSAWLCTPEHVGIVARYYAERVLRKKGNDATDEAEKAAETLARANLDSLAARYGEGHARDWIRGYDTDAEYIAECRAQAGRTLYSFRVITEEEPRHPAARAEGFTGAAYVQAYARCYQYQACDTGPEFYATEAGRISASVIARCAELLARRVYGDAHVWGYNEPDHKRITPRLVTEGAG